MPEVIQDAFLYDDPRHLAFLIHMTAQIRMTLLLVSTSSIIRGPVDFRWAVLLEMKTYSAVAVGLRQATAAYHSIGLGRCTVILV